MPNLILVRHSAVAINPTISHKEWQLSPHGKALSVVLAQRLFALKPNIIVTSKELKAVETAEIIADALNIPVHPMDDLHEHDRSNMGFLAPDDFHAGVAAFFAKPNSLVFGNETAEQVYQRYNWQIAELLLTYPNQNVIVVSHGTVMSLFIARNANLDPFAVWQRLQTPSYAVLSLPDFRLTEIIESVEEGHTTPTP